MHLIYLIFADNNGQDQFKIGVSKHVNKRILELRTANPNIVGTVHEYEIDEKRVAYKVETLLHNYYKELNYDGEWFLLEQEDIDKFINMCEVFEKNARAYFEIQENINRKYDY